KTGTAASTLKNTIIFAASGMRAAG
ncbi:transactivation protein, partial [Salmonella enterica subsp. enterica serovar Braenderup]|nr:transactivation protein [Salmonella enterica subsp. enterica serovar Braenderup]